MISASASYVRPRAVDVNQDPISPNNYKAVVNYQKPRPVNVSLAQNSLNYRLILNYVNPAFEATYRKLFAEVYADYDSRHRSFSDDAVLLEQVAKTFTKIIQDSVDPVDTLYFNLTSFPDDYAGASDAIVFTISWFRSFDDSVAGVDQIAKNFNKELDDTVTPSDGISSMVLSESGAGAVNGSFVNRLPVNGSKQEVII